MTDMYIALQETTNENLVRKSEFIEDQIRIDRDANGKIIGIEVINPWCFFVQDTRHDLIRNQNLVTLKELDDLVALAKDHFGNAELIPTEESFEEFYLYTIKVVFSKNVNATEIINKHLCFHSRCEELFPNINQNVFTVDIVIE